jgi:hypothetical protein
MQARFQWSWPMLRAAPAWSTSESDSELPWTAFALQLSGSLIRTPAIMGMAQLTKNFIAAHRPQPAATWRDHWHKLIECH